MRDVDFITKTIKRLKNWIYRYRRRKYLIIDENQEKVKWLGSKYGGFPVDENVLGGGNSAVVYTFGIGEDLSFSEAIFETNPLTEIYAYDPTPKSISYVKTHRLYEYPNFHFYPIGLSTKDEIASFFLPSNDSYVSGSSIYRNDLKTVGLDVDLQSLKTIAKNNGHTHIDLLKMDVEGSEFAVIESLEDNDITIDQICVEVHDRFYNDGIQKLQGMLRSLRDMGYLLVAVSESGGELDFVKSSCVTHPIGR